MTISNTTINTIFSIVITVGDYEDAWQHILYSTDCKVNAEKYLRLCTLRQLFAPALSLAELKDVLPNKVDVYESVRFHMETATVVAGLPEDFHESDLKSFEFQYEVLKERLG